MNPLDPNEPAFPTAKTSTLDRDCFGLTKGELFAAIAMNGILSNPRSDKFSATQIAEWSTTQAGALIAQLNKSK